MNALLKPILKKTYLFNSFSDDEISRVLDFSQHETLEAGDFLFMRGAHTDSFYIVYSGSIRLYSMSPKEEMEYSVHIELGGIIGEAAIVTNETRVMTAEALENSKIIRIPCGKLRDFLAQAPETEAKFYKALSQHLGNFVHGLVLELLRIREAHHIARHSLSAV